jgi:hypothetical protein
LQAGITCATTERIFPDDRGIDARMRLRGRLAGDHGAATTRAGLSHT